MPERLGVAVGLCPRSTHRMLGMSLPRPTLPETHPDFPAFRAPTDLGSIVSKAGDVLCGRIFVSWLSHFLSANPYERALVRSRRMLDGTGR